MGKQVIRASKPLILHSKLVCVSVVYLLAVLFLAISQSIFKSKCLLRSSPFDPIHPSSLFSYPSSYAPHKYPLSTTRSSCSSPVFFSDYWHVFNQIQNSRLQSWFSRPLLLYMQRNAHSFGGNFTPQIRFSYFQHRNHSKHLPCGFLKKFPIPLADQMAMEKCDGLVVVSAIFNDHDKIRQPQGLGSKTLDSVCFFMFIDDITLKGLRYHGLVSENSHEYRVGAWRLVKVWSEDLYENAAMNGVVPKYLVHRLFPNSKFSIWIDAKLQLMVDPLLLIHSLVISESVDMAISKHPFYVHTMDEAMATARWKKWWNVDALRTQMETYCENGLQPWTPAKFPYASDVAESGLILRKHGLRSNLFSCLMFNELEGFNPRDQLPFAFVRDRMRPRLRLYMFEPEVYEQVVLEFRHNLKPTPHISASIPKTSKSDLVYLNATCCSKCHKYLSTFWDD